jgi:hydroxylysine kinase
LARVPTTTALLGQLGRLLAQLHLGLADYRPHVPQMDLLWDITHADQLLPLVAEIDDRERRLLVESALRAFRDELLPMQPDLPKQVIHNDMNPYNLLVSADAAEITGIIDFGDMIEAARVNDLAVALSYHVGAPGGQALARAFLAGYRSLITPTPLENRALGLLIKARLAMTVVITESRAKLKPAEARYILRNHPVSLAGLRLLMAQTGDTDFLGD